MIAPVKNGRFAAIFFLWILAFNVSATDAEVYWLNEHAINRGLLDERYWQNGNWQAASPTVVTYMDMRLGAKANIGLHSLFVERRQVGTLITNVNSLTAAAQGSSALANSAFGSYPLNVRLRKFQFDAMGMSFSSKDHHALQWSVSPKILRLTSFSTGDGQGQLTLGGNSQQLSGAADRQGLSPFGFFNNPANPQISTGGSLDAQASWKSNDVMFRTEVTNWFSRIPVSNIHHSHTNYQLNVVGNALVFSDVPSLQGVYGQWDTTLRLPQIWKTSVSHQREDSGWTQSAGVISLEGGSILWAGLSYSRGDNTWMIRSHQLNNLFIRYEVKNMLVKQLTLEVTLGLADQHKHQQAITSVRYEF